MNESESLLPGVELLPEDPATMETIETVEVPEPRPLLSTPIADYTVSEGLLLLVFVLLLLKLFLDFVGRWF